MFVTELILEVALKEENHIKGRFSISPAICLYLYVCMGKSFHFHTSALVRAMTRGKESKMILSSKSKKLTQGEDTFLSKEIMSSKQIIMINCCPDVFY